jgi:hypothetical protein
VAAASTLVQMDRHATELDELDVEGILAFAERVLPSGSNLCGCRRRSIRSSGFSSCFFLRACDSTERDLLEPDSKGRMVDQTGIEPVTS